MEAARWSPGRPQVSWGNARVLRGDVLGDSSHQEPLRRGQWRIGSRRTFTEMYTSANC